MVVCALAMAIGLVARWPHGDTDGTVAAKDQVSTTACNRKGQLCRLRTCYRITYVTDSGRSRKSCVQKGRYDRVRIGDRFSG
ncbi:hypothetical protein ACIA3K_04200 [Micromonospora sp. NPDC051543]|uniref:hypothetical protein n=1 Tax=Micromonospora sp. NPDC051543 TaxID=3364287 RepID=UPI00378D68FE